MSNQIQYPGPKLLDQLCSVLRVMHCSYRTEKSHVYRARRFMYFHDKKHPKTMGACLESGSDIHTVQELLRHNDVKTTMIYTQVILT